MEQIIFGFISALLVVATWWVTARWLVGYNWSVVFSHIIGAFTSLFVMPLSYLIAWSAQNEPNNQLILAGVIICILILYFSAHNRDAPKIDQDAKPSAYLDSAPEQSNISSTYEPKKHISSISLSIQYESASGEITERTIDVLRYNPATGKIYAYCHLRRDNRSFFTDRVLESIDVDTGELIPDLDEYLLERLTLHKTSAQSAAETNRDKWGYILTQHGHALHILRYVAGSDGRMMPPERKIILDFLETQGAPIFDKIENYLKNEAVVPYESFLSHIEQIKLHPFEYRAALASAARAIVATGKTATDQESAAVERITSLILP